MNKKEKDSFEFIKNKNLLPFHLKEDLEKSNFLVIFVNQRSGSQEGTIIMELAKKYHHSSIKDFNILTFPIISNLIYSKTTSNLQKTNNNNKNNHNNNFHKKIEYEEKEIFSIIVFDILDKYDYQHGINFVKDYLNNYKTNNIKIIIGGGDGTILRLIEELKKNNIVMERCIFGSMPLGTGNDLSNSLGFGAEVNINYSINRLQKILYNYLIAKLIKIDIWELNIIIKENGLINEITSYGDKIMFEEENNKKPLKQFKKTFINYFSLGYDAKVGSVFEQKRSSNRYINKIIYGWEATKRYLFCKKNVKINKVLDFYIRKNDEYHSESSDSENESSSEDYKKLSKKEKLYEQFKRLKHKFRFRKTKKFSIFRTNPCNNQIEEFKQIKLKGRPVDLIGQNIDFYMGGTQGIWNKSDNIGIKFLRGKKYEKIKKKIINNFHEQSFDDKKIEFFTYNSGIEMAIERIFTGQSKRVYQGFGPVFLLFKENPNKSEFETMNKIYLNADGEFFHLMQPKEIILKLNDEICDGQINFLKNENWPLNDEESLNLLENISVAPNVIKKRYVSFFILCIFIIIYIINIL